MHIKFHAVGGGSASGAADYLVDERTAADSFERESRSCGAILMTWPPSPTLLSSSISTRQG